MRLRGLLIAPLLLAPDAAAARDVATCAALYQQLQNAPAVIGNSGEMRRYALQLGQQNTQIRQLRIQMRQAGCSVGSIVVVGAATDACKQMQQTLQSMEDGRDSITAERDNSRNLTRSSDPRTAILASIRQNACLPTDLEEQQKAEEKDRVRVRGLEIPKDDAAASGTPGLRTPRLQRPIVAVAQPVRPAPVERPYVPNKKVRMVGPVFLPAESIDLAHPRSGGGPQPQQ